MKSLPVGLIISFIAGSAATVLFFSLTQSSLPSVPLPVTSSKETNIAVNLTQIDQRLRNIELRLTENSSRGFNRPTQDTATLTKAEQKTATDISDNTVAVQLGNSIVERALQNRTVTEAELNALASVKNLTEEDRKKLLSKLATAINNNQIKFELQGSEPVN